MADISAFPTIQQVVYTGDNFQSYKAGAAIKAGQVVAIHGTGVSRTVHPAVAGTTEAPLGVAVFDAASGAEVTVAGIGCIVYVANADDTTAIDAGHFAIVNDNAVGGTVSSLVDTAVTYAVGIAIDDIAGGGTGRILINPQYVSKSAA